MFIRAGAPVRVDHPDGDPASPASARDGKAGTERPVIATAERVDPGGPAELAAARDDRPVQWPTAGEVADQGDEGGGEVADPLAVDFVVVGLALESVELAAQEDPPLPATCPAASRHGGGSWCRRRRVRGGGWPRSTVGSGRVGSRRGDSRSPRGRSRARGSPPCPPAPDERNALHHLGELPEPCRQSHSGRGRGDRAGAPGDPLVGAIFETKPVRERFRRAPWRVRRGVRGDGPGGGSARLPEDRDGGARGCRAGRRRLRRLACSRRGWLAVGRMTEVG